MRKLLVLTTFLLSAELLFAQTTSLGGGYSGLSMINKFDKKAKNGLHAGGWYNSDDDFFLSGMIYLTLPTTFDDFAPGEYGGLLFAGPAKYTSNLKLFDVNYGRYLIGDFTEDFGIYTTYGMALSYYKQDFYFTDPLFTKPVDYDKNDYRSRDLMLSLGGGVDYAPHSKGKVYAGLKFYLPLLHVSTAYIQTPYFIDFSIGYRYFLNNGD